MDIKFETGLLKVTDDSISLQWNENNVSMYRWQIGKVDVVTSKELKLMPIIYGFRLAALSFIPLILLFIIQKPIFSWAFIFMMVVGVLIVLGDLILDGLFGLNVVHNSLLNVVGHEFTSVRIQNTSGQDIEFYILPEERSKARSIVDLRIEKDKQPKTIKSEDGDIITQIEKLHALKEKGIISVDEFEKKKSQLLNI